MFAGSKEGSNDNDEDGIILGHAYSLLDVYELKVDDQDVRLMKLRNPWGKKGEWDGDWSDKSEKWTPELK